MEIAVLFGGQSRERLVSVATAQNVAANLDATRFAFWKISGEVCLVDKSELIAFQDPFRKEFSPAPSTARWNQVEDFFEWCKLKQVCIFNACHGGAGENGDLAALLEAVHVPFTGSGSRACALAFDKGDAKRIASGIGVTVPRSFTVSGTADERRAKIAQACSAFGQIVLKPIADGSSFGLHFISREPPASVLIATEDIYLAEERISGREVTVAVADVGYGETAFPVVEIRCEHDRIFDYGSKYLGGAKELCPAQITSRESDELKGAALAIHRSIGAYGYSRSDFILSKGGAVFLEINTLPGLTSASLLPLALSASGIPMKQFLAHQVHIAQVRG